MSKENDHQTARTTILWNLGQNKMKQQTPFPRNQGTSRAKAKTHHFPFLDVGRRGGRSIVSIYFVQECVCNVQYTRGVDCSNYTRVNCVQHGGLSSPGSPPPPPSVTLTHLYVGLFAAFEMWKPNVILSTSFEQLLDMLKFYTGFEINDVTGKNLVYKCASVYFTLPAFI